MDREKYLVHMPFVATTRTATPQFIGVHLPKFKAPLPKRFIRHHDPALCQKLFNIAKAEREAKIQPNRVADNFGSGSFEKDSPVEIVAM